MKYSFIIFLVLCFLSCDKSDPATPRELCGSAIIIDADRMDADSDGFAIVDATVEGTCLTVTIATTGCSSQGWELDLVTSGNIAESLPTQSGARLIFANPAAGGITCQAEIQETYVFDLSDYLTAGALPTLFTLEGREGVFEIE